MATANGLSKASLLFALVLPTVSLLLFLLHSELDFLPEAVAIAAVPTVLFFCPLAAAFCGHATRRQMLKAGQGKGPGYVLAGVGIGLGYLELAFVALLFVATPHHPNHIAVYEASAVGSLVTINRAELAFSKAHPSQGYTKQLQDLALSEGHPEQEWSIDQLLASGSKSRYRFTYFPSSSKQDGILDRYQVHADPENSPRSVMRHLFTDQTGVIRFANGDGPANQSSAELK